MGKQMVFLSTCPSTNTRLMEMSVEKEIPEGTILITNDQTAGRGQRGNSWISQESLNLTFSFILYPSMPVSRQFLITQAVSLAISDYLDNHVKTFIKWPNDLLVGQQKIGGILIENTLAGQLVDKCIVGIGININQKDFQLPRVTSLAGLTGRAYSLQGELDLLLSYLEARILQLKHDRWEELRENYMMKLYALGETRLFWWNEKRIKGTIKGVDTSGRLLMQVDNVVHSFDLKEIEWIW